MKRLEAALNMEGVGEPDDGSVPSVH
jgi:hypothetical protein